MSVFIKFMQETDIRANVYFVHNDPTKLTEEEKAEGIVIDSLIEPPEEVGKIKTIYINPQDTTQQWTEDSLFPKTSQQEVLGLVEDVLVLSEALFLALEKIEILEGVEV